MIEQMSKLCSALISNDRTPYSLSTKYLCMANGRPANYPRQRLKFEIPSIPDLNPALGGGREGWRGGRRPLRQPAGRPTGRSRSSHPLLLTPPSPVSSLAPAVLSCLG